MNITLNMTAEEFRFVWAGLGELPAKYSHALMSKLQEQVETQEASAVALARSEAQSAGVPSSPEAELTPPAST